MNIKSLKKCLTNLLSDKFVVYDNSDKGFEDFNDDVIVLIGENEKQIFAIKITKC